MLSIDLKSYNQSCDYQYLELLAINNSTRQLPAVADVTSSQNFLTNPWDYKLTVDRCSVNLSEVPMFTAEDKDLLFTIRSKINSEVYNGNVNYPATTEIYNVNEILTLFNANLIVAIDTIQPLIPAMPAGSYPGVTYDPTTRLFTFYMPSNINDFVELCLNTNLRELFRGNYYTFGSGEYCLLFSAGFNNQNVSGSFFINVGTYSSINAWYSIYEILVLTNSFPVTAMHTIKCDVLSQTIQQGDTRSLLADFVVDIDYVLSSPSDRLTYIPLNPRIINFSRTKDIPNLRHINIYLAYRTRNGVIRPIILNQRDSFDVVMKFSKALTS